MIYHRFRRGLAFALLLCWAPLLEAQQQSVDEKLNQVLAELKQIRELLDNRNEVLPSQRMERVVVNVGDAPMLGLKEAPFTIVEFTDYQCPYCRQFHELRTALTN